MLVYVDTNIFLDFLLGRTCDFTGRDLAQSAGRFFDEILDSDSEIVVSEWMEEELYNQIEESQAEMLLKHLEGSIRTISYDSKDREKAKNIDNENPDDALHALLADKAGADVIVTQNVSDYRNIDIVPARKPRDLKII